MSGAVGWLSFLAIAMSPRSRFEQEQELIGRVTNVARWVLLGVSVIAASTAAVWLYAPSVVDTADRSVVEAHVSLWERRLKRAKRLEADGNRAEAEKLLRKVVEGLAAVNKGERLDPIKRDALRLLSGSLAAQGRSQEALDTIERWITFDDRDLRAQIMRGTVIARLPGRAVEGADILRSWARRIPEVNLVNDALTVTLLKQGDVSGAVEPLARQQSDLAGTWQLFWDTGTGFRGDQSTNIDAQLDEGRRMSLTFSVPAGTRGLRLDPPAEPARLLLRPMVTLAGDGRPASRFELWRGAVRHNETTASGEVIVVRSGMDPYFHWPIQPLLHAATGEFRARVVPARSDELWAVIASPHRRQELEKGLVARGRPDLARLLADSWRARCLLDSVDVSWLDSSPDFHISAHFSLRDSKIEARFPLDAESDTLRIDLPNVWPLVYELDTLALDTSGGPVSLAGADLRIEQLHSIRRTGRRFEVFAPDPHFIVHLPEQMKLSSVHLRGELP